MIYFISGRTCVNGCPPLSVFYGVVTYNTSANGGQYPVGTKGTTACDDPTNKFDGTISGWGIRMCQQSGVWNGWPAVCKRSNENICVHSFIFQIFNQQVSTEANYLLY